jgi:hypothetical protein
MVPRPSILATRLLTSFGCVLLLLGTLAIATGAPTAGVRAAEHPSPAAHDTATLAFHANLYASTPPLTGGARAGLQVELNYKVAANGSQPLVGSAVVRIPEVVAMLPTTRGVLDLFFASLNVTVNGTQPRQALAETTQRFTSALTFVDSTPGVVSSQGLAVEASWPNGQHSVTFQWNWVLVQSNGSTTLGTPSAPETVVPAQIVDFLTMGGKSWVDGTNYRVCLAGPVEDRNFSVHVALVTPASLVDTGTVGINTSTASPFCWNLTMAAAAAPQNLTFHLWETTNISFMLDVVQVQLVAASVQPSGHTTPGTTGQGGTLPMWEWFALAAAVVLAVLAAVALMARRQRAPPAAAPTSSGPTMHDVGPVGGPDSPQRPE